MNSNDPLGKDVGPHSSFELVPSDDADLPAEGRAPTGEAAYAAFEEEESGADVGRYVAAILRYKWIIVLVTILGTAAGVGVASRIAPEYTARTTLWIETGGSDQAGPIRPEQLLESSSWIELLQSGIVLDPVVRDHRLFISAAEPQDSVLIRGLDVGEQFAPGTYRIRVDPTAGTYVLETRQGAMVERGSFGDSVGVGLGMEWRPELAAFPADRAVAFSLRSPREVAMSLAQSLEPALDRNGNFLQIQLTGEDPERLASTLNAVSRQYVEVAADLKRARLDELVSLLEDQLEYAQQRLRDAEIALEDFRVQTVTLPSDRSTPISPGIEATRDPVFSNYFQMQVELETVRQEQDAIRRALSADGETDLEGLRSVGAVQASAEMTAALQELNQMRSELRALRYRYTDEHPPVRSLIQDIETLESQTLPRIARQLLNELAAHEQQLEERLASASDQLEQIPPRSIEETRLQRAVASADNLYGNLLRRFEEARLSAASSIPDVRILDEAVVPRQPSEDQKPQLILLAFVGSLGLGILGAILRDRTDRRLHYPEQVTTDLGLAILGGVPTLRAERGLFRRDNSSEAQEAFRSLRLSVMHAYGAAGPLVSTVTSPQPGDGKSFVTANLGRAFADIGKRTLLIDGDTRRGELHSLVDVERKPGLIDALRHDEQPADRVIRGTAHPNLFILPSGTRAHDGPELLSTRAMRDLLIHLRTKYDVILIDSPPLGAGVDPFALSTLTGSLLLVLRTGETDREMADAKLELLERLPVRVLGAVMNGVPADRRSRYYRYFSYTPGYETREEDEAVTAVLKG